MANTTGKKWGGRQKGTPNKLSTTVKENVIAVFNQLGGTENMAEWAKDNPTPFFNIYAKLLPTELDGQIEHLGGIRVDIHVVDPKA